MKNWKIEKSKFQKFCKIVFLKKNCVSQKFVKNCHKKSSHFTPPKITQKLVIFHPYLDTPKIECSETPKFTFFAKISLFAFFWIWCKKNRKNTYGENTNKKMAFFQFLKFLRLFEFDDFAISRDPTQKWSKLGHF